MRRASIFLVTIIFTLFLGGCGGNTENSIYNNDSLSGSVSVEALSFSDNNGSVNLTLEFSATVSSGASLQIENIAIESDKFQISNLIVAPTTLTFSSSGAKNVVVSFDYNSTTALQVSDLKLSYKETYISNLSGDKLDISKENVSILFVPNTNDTTATGDEQTVSAFGYHLDSVSKNISISNTGSSYQIEIALYFIDEYGRSSPVVNENIVADFIQPIYGKMDSYTQTTDSSGIAKFTYISPQRIDDINYTTLKFYREKDLGVFLEIDLNFDIQSDKQVYDLYLEPSNFVVSTPSQTKEIRIVTVNSKNVGIATTIQVEQLANGDGNSYGSFEQPSTFTTDESGVATLNYTAPTVIPGATFREIEVSATDASGNVIVKKLKIDFQTVNETNATAYDIDIINENTLEVNSTGSITVKIFKEGNVDEIISNSYVNEVNVSTAFTNMIEINGSSNTTYSNIGIKVIPVTTSTISGTALIDLSANIFDGEKNVTISKRVPVVILSGPISSLSLVYVSTTYDEENGLFIDRWNIHAVDKYANPAREGISLYPTLINGYKRVGYAAGSIVAGDPANFTDAAAPFGAVDVNPPNNDRLIIMPQSTPEKIDKSYLGDWTISRVVDSSTLELEDIYAGPDASQLKYIIGSEKRALADVISIADIKSAEPDGTYKTDADGNVRFDVTYDPMLVGHTLTLSAKTYNGTERSGTAIRTNFRGEGYTVNSKKIDNDGNTHTVTLSISIKPNGEPLVGVQLIPDSITSDSGQCTLAPNHPPIYTNNNGSFTVSIDTAGDINKANECTISWEPSNASIYYEY